MAELILEQRVTNLEEAMVELVKETTRLSQEMREFKEEIRLNSARRDAEFEIYEHEWRAELEAYREKSEVDLQRYQREWRANFQTYRREWRAELEAHREKSEGDFQTYRREWRAELEAYREKSEADWQVYREKSEADFQTYRREWRAELQGYREKSEADTRDLRREMNQQYGQITDKLGTLAEDLVAPSLPRILQEVVTCPQGNQVSMAVRVRRYHPTKPGQSQEYDVIASCGGYALFNETKSRLRPGDVEGLVERLEQVRDYFPEYQGVKIIGSLASLYVDPSLVRHANRQGLLVLATGDELMDVLNEPGMTLREF